MLKKIILEIVKITIYTWNQFWVSVAGVPRGCMIAFFVIIILIALMVAYVWRWDARGMAMRK